MYDLIGDIHGHADELVELLEAMGYQRREGVYRHKSRTAVFVGDFIDRGRQIRRVLDIARAMCESHAAVAVIGNHEFNALAFHTPHPNQPGKFLRDHSEKNFKQHSSTLQQVPESELADHLEWFRRLPIWLELDGVRVVHACWNPKQLGVIETALREFGGLSTEFLLQATDRSSELFQAVDEVVKGKEIELPNGISFLDKDGHARSALRIQWYRPPENETVRSYALMSDDSLPDDSLPNSAFGDVMPYPADAPPVFFGHYWLRAQRPTRLAPNVACLDYSVAKSGCLCAYRWDGEPEIDDAKFVTVPARHHV
ncbi:MAG: diadenosine tetraphosphatase [Gemmatales bacterium]|nr:MAG: diadenosine tetraphosphatase [Gemmatales bacterium]